MPGAWAYRANQGQVSGSGRSESIQRLAMKHKTYLLIVWQWLKSCQPSCSLFYFQFMKRHLEDRRSSNVTLWWCTLQSSPATNLRWIILQISSSLFSSVIGRLKMTCLYGRNEIAVSDWGCMLLFSVRAKLYKHKHCYSLMAAKWLGSWLMCDCNVSQWPV